MTSSLYYNVECGGEEKKVGSGREWSSATGTHLVAAAGEEPGRLDGGCDPFPEFRVVDSMQVLAVERGEEGEGRVTGVEPEHILETMPVREVTEILQSRRELLGGRRRAAQHAAPPPPPLAPESTQPERQVPISAILSHLTQSPSRSNHLALEENTKSVNAAQRNQPWPT